MTAKSKKADTREAFEEDPVKEIRRIRDEISKRFHSVKAYLAYLDTVPSATELLKEIERKKLAAARPKNAKTPPAKIKKRDEGKQRAKI